MSATPLFSPEKTHVYLCLLCGRLKIGSVIFGGSEEVLSIRMLCSGVELVQAADYIGTGVGGWKGGIRDGGAVAGASYQDLGRSCTATTSNDH
jgi:hypothetical protein